MRRGGASVRTAATARAAGAAVAAALACAALLTGCTPLPEAMTDASAQGLAAVRTAELALELDADGRSWPGVTTTSLSDAERELADAARSAADADVTTPDEQALRDETLAALRAGLDAVNAARASVTAEGGGADEASVTAALDAAADDLEALVEAGGA
ncbi:hypothetical protein ACGGZK_03320 [Agromyces sp. MMS24-K17]|uniref:hypothetical protein n=1 Tax=Agromyces sp. MMS24-K17 TaxID=3372850 RepID=UPI0037541B4F